MWRSAIWSRTRPGLRSGIPSWRSSSPTRTPPATGCVFGIT